MHPATSVLSMRLSRHAFSSCPLRPTQKGPRGIVWSCGILESPSMLFAYLAVAGASLPIARMQQTWACPCAREHALQGDRRKVRAFALVLLGFSSWALSSAFRFPFPGRAIGSAGEGGGGGFSSERCHWWLPLRKVHFLLLLSRRRRGLRNSFLPVPPENTSKLTSIFCQGRHDGGKHVGGRAGLQRSKHDL